MAKEKLSARVLAGTVEASARDLVLYAEEIKYKAGVMANIAEKHCFVEHIDDFHDLYHDLFHALTRSNTRLAEVLTAITEDV